MTETRHQHQTGRGRAAPYRALALNLVLSAIVMYLVMFAMIDGLHDFYHNLGTAWMAVAMVAPMGTLMLLTMPGMYPDARLNLVLHGGFLLVFAAAFMLIREQGGIGDRQFLRSMIPHHSGAVLMCREARLSDPELRALCTAIARQQREEIELMRAMLARL